MKSSRKTLTLAVSIIALVLLGMTVRTPASGPDRNRPFPPRQLVKHVILFIGDGMQLEHEIATSRYLRGHDYKLSFHGLPYRGDGSTWDISTYNNYATALGVPEYDPLSFDPLVGYDPARGGTMPFPLTGVPEFNYFIPPYDWVHGAWPKPYATDSASAATAWATGVKTDAGNIAWLPDDPADGALKTIAELVREQKEMAMGVVSTVPFTHATPAAHVSHNVNRNNYHDIANEMIQVVQPDVVIGGGHPLYARRSGDGRYIPDALYDAVKGGAYPYVFVERQTGVDGGVALLDAVDEVDLALGEKLFGLFGGTGGNFESPIPTDDPGNPSVVRGSSENPWLKDATVAALEVLSQNENGFFVMIEQGDIDWANHGNNFAQMVGTTYDLDEAVKAAMAFVRRPGDDVTWGNTLLIVTSDHSNSYMRIVTPLEKGDLPTQEVTTSCPAGDYCGAFTYPNGEVTYATSNHTNELVRIYARGKGTKLFKAYEGTWYPGTKVIDNTQLFRIMAQAFALDY
jgi:alkaline phosphatase